MTVSLTKTPVTGSEGLETFDSDKLLNSDIMAGSVFRIPFTLLLGWGGATEVLIIITQNVWVWRIELLGSRTNFYVWTLDFWVVCQNMEFHLPSIVTTVASGKEDRTSGPAAPGRFNMTTNLSESSATLSCAIVMSIH